MEPHNLERVHYNIMNNGGLRSVMKGGSYEEGRGGLGTDTTQQAFYQKEVNAKNLHCLNSSILTSTIKSETI